MTLRAFLIGTFTALAVISCGGGGGGGLAGGIGGTGISYGPVNGFGSVVVNGTRYTTTGASYSGEINSLSQLAEGMVVTVTHDGTTTASAIDYRDNVEGPLANRDLANNTMTVLGLSIQMNNLTVFKNTTGLTGTGPLADNNMVEVSGLIVAPNTVRATRVERKSTSCPTPVGGLEVKGTVSNLTGTTFVIGGLIVDYTTASLPDGIPTNDAFVEVKAANCPSGGTLTAVSVEYANEGADSGDASEGDELELKGFVTIRSDSCSLAACTFTLNGQSISTTTATVLEEGTLSGLVNGALIEVKGDLNSAGTLVASRIEFEAEGAQESELEIRAIPSAKTRTAFNVGTVTLLDRVIQVTTATLFEGGSSSSPFNLDSIIANSTCLDMRLFTAGDALVAARIKKEDDCETVELQGPVSSVSNPSFYLLGIRIETSGSTSFENSADTGISQGAFFTAISAGSPVAKAEGLASAYSSGVLTASKVKIED